jgi:hypothetical protein
MYFIKMAILYNITFSPFFFQEKTHTLTLGAPSVAVVVGIIDDPDGDGVAA